jgi:3-isopropylmalate/(R)-2-methylmalate dehydratase small subunit
MKRLALLEGLDDITRTLTRRVVIEAWQAADRLNRPWVWDQVEIVPDAQA